MRHTHKKAFLSKETSKSFYYPTNDDVYIKQANFLTCHPAVLRGAAPTCRERWNLFPVSGVETLCPKKKKKVHSQWSEKARKVGKRQKNSGFICFEHPC